MAAKKKDSALHLKVAADVGNGYVKGFVNGRTIDEPAHAVKRYNTGFEKPLPTHPISEHFKNAVYDYMDVTIASSLVLDTVRRIYGESAKTSGSPLEEFDVFSPQSKADVDLFGVLLLGNIVADTLTQYWQENDTFPEETFNIHVDLATALPIMEYVQNEATLASKILNNGMGHHVTILNFEKPISFNIVFDSVVILNEGEAAQRRIQTANDVFKEYLIEDAKSRFENGELDDVTGDDIVNLKNTLAIDIGEGTTDFAVFSNGQFNQKASRSVNHGYGLVLENALEILRSENYTYTSRKELSEFLNSEPSKLARIKWNHVKSIVDEEAAKFTDEIVSDTSRIYTGVGSFVEAIFVSGGGATPLEPWLFDKLQDLIASYGPEQLVPIIYLDSTYSRYLNATGLYSVLNGDK